MVQFSLNAVRYEDVRAGVINFLKENGVYQAAFDYEGSNLAYQIDVAAYTTMLLSYQNTLLSNNIFIDTTEIRKNAASIAKRMGYKPKRKISARFLGSIEYIADSSVDGYVPFVDGDIISIPAETQFLSSPTNYIFVNPSVITLTHKSDILLSGDFIILEGEYQTASTFGLGIKSQEIVIESLNVEENNLQIFIRNTNTDNNPTNNDLWENAKPFFSTSNQKIYFIEEDVVDEFKPKIIFGDGILGQIPTITERIDLKYLETKGIIGNNELSADFFGTPTVTITAAPGGHFASISYDNTLLSVETSDNSKSSGGKDAETLEEIKFAAPRFFSTGGRGVNQNDYVVLLGDFPALRYFNAEGGNVLFPKLEGQLGKIYVSAIPFFDDTDFINNQKIYLSEVEENEITPTIKDKTVLSTSKVFLKPVYIYLELNSIIELPNNFTITETQTAITDTNTKLKEYVGNDFNDIITPGLQGLALSYRHSQTVSIIANTDSLIGAEIDIVHYFIINHDSFYQSRQTTLNLPIIYQRDSNGNILLDNNNIPKTDRFIKKRSDIITEENKLREQGDRESINVIVLKDTADSLGGKYFLIYGLNKLNIETKYYVWFDVGNGSIEPVVSSATGIEVDISLNDTAKSVATAMSTALKLVENGNIFTTIENTEIITITNVEFGIVTDPTDVDTGFTLTIIIDGKNTNYYDAFSLPVNKSSVYGSLEHLNSDRELYNIDITEIPIITWEIIGPFGQEELLFQTTSFLDENEIKYTSNLVEITGGTWPVKSWFVQLNGRNIATLNQISLGIFTLTVVDEAFLRDTIKIIQNEDTKDFIAVEKVTETDENNFTKTFYSLNVFLNNEVLSDVRINSKNKLFDVIFDASTFLYTYTNIRTLTNIDETAATIAPVDPNSTDTSAIEIDHFSNGVSVATILEMQHFNGAFTMVNNNNGDLKNYEQRNDLELIQNFSTAQEISKTSYELSSFSDPIDNLVIVVLNSLETTDITCTDNLSQKLDGTWFKLHSNLDTVQYYVWFDGTGNTPDPEPAALGIGIRIHLINGESSTKQQVAIDLATVINTNINFTTIIGVDAGVNDFIVTIKTITAGKTTSISQGDTISTNAVSAAILDSAGFSDETADANSVDIIDVSITNDTETSINDGDFFYVASTAPFNLIDFDLTNNTMDITSGTILADWEYWNNSTWNALSNVQDYTVNGTAEVTDIVINGTPVELDGKYFNLYSANDTEQYYVWYDLDNGSTDPAPGATGIEVDISTGDSEATIALATQQAIDALTDFTVTVSTVTVTITNVVDGPTTDATDGNTGFSTSPVVTTSGSGDWMTALDGIFSVKWKMPSDMATTTINSQGPFYYVRAKIKGYTTITTSPKVDQIFIKASATPFIIDIIAKGSTNLIDDIDKFAIGDLLRVETSSNANNDGFFLVAAIDSTLGTIDVYNINGVLNITGVGTITHYKVIGTYGSFTVNIFDFYHNSTIGILDYDDGNIKFNEAIKGYTDKTDETNLKTIVKNIASLFNNYSFTGANKMDKIKITPIDKINNLTEDLGKETDFDAFFNQSIQTKITLPIVKT